jgi:hypothetical protein
MTEEKKVTLIIGEEYEYDNEYFDTQEKKSGRNNRFIMLMNITNYRKRLS